MTKTLTEQWREGTLPEGYYYTKINDTDANSLNVIVINYCWDDHSFQDYPDEWIQEVLAPVPSYDEYKDLLDLNVYEKDRKKVIGLENKIKRLQEQLSEANEVVKGYSKLESLINYASGNREKSPAQKYVEKWGVK